MLWVMRIMEAMAAVKPRHPDPGTEYASPSSKIHCAMDCLFQSPFLVAELPTFQILVQGH